MALSTAPYRTQVPALSPTLNAPISWEPPKVEDCPDGEDGESPTGQSSSSPPITPATSETSFELDTDDQKDDERHGERITSFSTKQRKQNLDTTTQLGSNKPNISAPLSRRSLASRKSPSKISRDDAVCATPDRSQTDHEVTQKGGKCTDFFLVTSLLFLRYFGLQTVTWATRTQLEPRLTFDAPDANLLKRHDQGPTSTLPCHPAVPRITPAILMSTVFPHTYSSSLPSLTTSSTASSLRSTSPTMNSPPVSPSGRPKVRFSNRGPPIIHSHGRSSIVSHQPSESLSRNDGMEDHDIAQSWGVLFDSEGSPTPRLSYVLWILASRLVSQA